MTQPATQSATPNGRLAHVNGIVGPHTPANVAAIIWQPCVSDAVRALAEPILDRWRWLIPSWCHELLVFYRETDGDNAAAACRTYPEYRYAQLMIYGSFVGKQRPDDRENAIIHELLHVQLQPLVQEFKHLLAQQVPEGPLREWANTNHTGAMEGVVCDLARAFQIGAAPRE